MPTTHRLQSLALLIGEILDWSGTWFVAAGCWIGKIFREDPRIAALAYARDNLPLTWTVEIIGSVPRMQDLPCRKLKVVKIPTRIERDASFAKMFAGDGQMQDAMKRWTTKEGPEWFSQAAQAARNSDWIFGPELTSSPWSSRNTKPFFGRVPAARLCLTGPNLNSRGEATRKIPSSSADGPPSEKISSPL